MFAWLRQTFMKTKQSPASRVTLPYRRDPVSATTIPAPYVSCRDEVAAARREQLSPEVDLYATINRLPLAQVLVIATAVADAKARAEAA